ncbi:MAG: ABC transporter permease [Candidatus Adiutrix sp.]|jgi:D-methionine transport system permease protein|nr:ABC transporter permease [Candidatus Adiutrix sp.]
MVSASSLLTTVFGVPLGLVLVVTRRGHIMESPVFNSIFGAIVNAVRSVPFIIFLVFISPFTRQLVGASIGPTAAIVALTLAALVFMARLAETALLEVGHGVIEAAQSAGATNWQIIRHVLLPEARPGLIQAVTITVISLIGYSAMAGAIGGGGLGDLAVRYGYQRYQIDIMLVTVIILMAAVQGLQSLGDYLARKFDRRF